MRFSLLFASSFVAVFASTACTVQETSTTAPPGNAPPADQGGDQGGDTTAPPDDTTTPPATPPSAKPPKLTLDSSFAIADATNEIDSAAPGPNGATYVALRKAGGSLGWGNGTILRRYLANGSLDSAFATKGELETKLVANPQALAVDATGRILVGGTGLYDPDTTSDTGREIVVVRVTSAGAVDTTYASSGRTKLSFSPANVWTTSLRVRDDGGALVNVYGRTNGNDAFGSFLIGASGTVIATYGTSGFKSSQFPTDGAVAIGDDVLLPTTAGLVRYGADGKIAGTAISDGVVAAKTGKDGKFVAVVTDGKTFSLARYSASGQKDKTFASSTVSEDFADFEILTDGSVIVADGGALSWVAPTGGAAVVLVKDASAGKLATTSDGKLLVTTTNEKVQRYAF